MHRVDAGMDARQAGGLLSQQAGKPVPSVPAMERLRAMCSILGACLLAMAAQELDVAICVRMTSRGAMLKVQGLFVCKRGQSFCCHGQWQYQADLLVPVLCLMKPLTCELTPMAGKAMQQSLHILLHACLEKRVVSCLPPLEHAQ